MATERNGAIGIFDSGVGGLSVLRPIRRLLPGEDLLYFADQAHIPYGTRPAEEICRLSAGISRYLAEQGAKLIVVACNTASAAALGYLRSTFSRVPIVGMEPAVKPAANQTRNGKVGVLATPGTFDSDRYASLMARFAQNVQVFEDPCPGLVEQIETEQFDASETERILSQALAPMLTVGVDTLVLGCTHYPFVLPLIQRLAGPSVTVIDPAPAVARQVSRVLQESQLASQSKEPGKIQIVTTGEVARLELVAKRWLGQDLTVTPAAWQSGYTLSSRAG